MKLINSLQLIQLSQLNLEPLEKSPLTGINSPFTVTPISAGAPSGCIVSQAQLRSLTDAGFSKMTCPFGVVIAGTPRWDEGSMLYSANIVANLLDPE